MDTTDQHPDTREHRVAQVYDDHATGLEKAYERRMRSCCRNGEHEGLLAEAKGRARVVAAAYRCDAILAEDEVVNAPDLVPELYAEAA